MLVCVGRSTAAQTPMAYASATEQFGAIGDDTADDTAAIQACIDYAQDHRTPCLVPAGTYKITGAGLRITRSGTSVQSTASSGGAQAVLKYYGTSSALSIGDGTHVIYAVNLRDLAIAAADDSTAAVGIDCRVLSGADWHGLTIGGSITSGKFKAGIRFVDSGIVAVRHLVLSNREGVTGSTGIIFDEPGPHGGNAHIVIDGGDIFNQNTIYDVRSCQHCVIENVWHEGYDEALVIDTARITSSSLRVDNLVVQNNSFVATLRASYQQRQVIWIRATAAKTIWVPVFTFAGNRVFNAGGVRNPIKISISEASAGSLLGLVVRDGTYQGTEDALIRSDSPVPRIRIDGLPFVRTADAKDEPPYVVGPARLIQ